MTITAQNKTVLEPEKIPSVAIDFMNNTHFEEIALVQEIGNLIQQYRHHKTETPEEQQQITHMLQQWQEHTRTHFARGNTLMQEYDFPAYPVHAHEHEMALEKLQSVINAWEEQKNIEQLAHYIFVTWPGWFSQHVQTMDAMTAKFAILHGFEAE